MYNFVCIYVGKLNYHNVIFLIDKRRLFLLNLPGALVSLPSPPGGEKSNGCMNGKKIIRTNEDESLCARLPGVWKERVQSTFVFDVNDT